jgi:L-serine dehydratase
MESIKEIYKIGFGPSSSHTMGPKFASEFFKNENKKAKSFRVTLYGSLAATGKGHLTDQAIINTLKPFKVNIIWKPDERLPFHPNGMLFEALGDNKNVIHSKIIYSIGGGALHINGAKNKNDNIYQYNTMEEILNWCNKHGKPLWKYVFEIEGTSIIEYLTHVWEIMKKTIQNGLSKEGYLPGKLKLARKSHSFLLKTKRNTSVFQRTGLILSYALSVSEENASGSEVVTAPTCGSCGVVPAVLKYLHDFFHLRTDDIVKGLATAGIIGNLVKKNASISGAEVGCQGEIGTACAMASAAAAQIMGGNEYQIEYAAEMGLEHHLGLTCDPVDGLVQIPCIERNAFAATRVVACADYALLTDGRHRVSFDHIVKVMMQTGLDMKRLYKETSLGGLAKFFHE